MDIQLKRAYAPVSTDDGARVLVDRLWPRGVSREKARLDLWLKEIAPSTDLRKWFHHDPTRWDEFQSRYRQELEHNPGAIQQIEERAQKGRVTLVYAAKDEAHNEAVVLKQFLADRA